MNRDEVARIVDACIELRHLPDKAREDITTLVCAAADSTGRKAYEMGFRAGMDAAINQASAAWVAAGHVVERARR